MSRKREDKPLTIRTVKGVLTIEIGIETLAFCTQGVPAFYDSMEDRKKLNVTNAKGFAKDVESALCCEAEDGATLITAMLDLAMQDAVESGSVNVDEIDE